MIDDSISLTFESGSQTQSDHLGNGNGFPKMNFANVAHEGQGPNVGGGSRSQGQGRF